VDFDVQKLADDQAKCGYGSGTSLADLMVTHPARWFISRVSGEATFACTEHLGLLMSHLYERKLAWH
jgi:hypothetical protein